MHAQIATYTAQGWWLLWSDVSRVVLSAPGDWQGPNRHALPGMLWTNMHSGLVNCSELTLDLKHEIEALCASQSQQAG
jgi:hypothetical protein